MVAPAGGFLTGKYQKDGGPPEGSRLDKWKERYAGFDKPRNWKILDTVKAIARELEAKPAQVALAWLVRKPEVTSVIFGARSLPQLDDNLGAAQINLSNAEMARLDEASEFELGYPYSFMHSVMGSW